MNIKISTVDSTKLKCDALLFTLTEGSRDLSPIAAAIDQSLNGLISDLIACGEITGKLHEFTPLHSMGKLPARIIAVTGLGKKNALSDEKRRAAVAQSCRALRRLQCRSIAIVLDDTDESNIETAAQSVVEGSMLGLYTFNKYKTDRKSHDTVNTIIVNRPYVKKNAAVKSGCLRGQVLAEAAMLSRDLANEPGNHLTPTDMANAARELAMQNNLDIAVLDTAQLKKLKMGAFLGVAQGSQQPPKFIIMKYKGNPESNETLGLVGKGITFDSGGISLKPAENMGDMKGDMAGGATVMAALTAIARMKMKINVTALVPATENLPGSNALKPGDVVRASNGKTIEIITTDAEGRLTLADALCYAVSQKITRIIDIATLTGACHIALGDVCSGIFSNNRFLAKLVMQAGDKAGECMWQMPMHEEYKELNKSDVADMKNSGGRYGGAITAAQFLSEFVGSTPWVHIDIAGTSDTIKESGYKIKGATGTGVRTLVNLAEALADKKKRR